jgi:hypothetical protein
MSKPPIHDLPEAGPTPVDDPRAEMADAAPPVLGSWRNVYLLTLGALTVYIVVFWAISEAYR